MVSFAQPSQPNPVDVSKMQTFIESEKSRTDQYASARAAYNGVFPDPFKVLPGGIKDTIKVNRVKPIVWATINFLFGTAPGWEIPASIDGENSEMESKREEWLTECLRVNKWEQVLLDLGINGAICGTPYAAIDLSNLIPNPKDAKRGFPRLHVLDPSDMTITWSPLDIGTITSYRWQYNTYDAVRKEQMVVRRLIELKDDGRWWITDQRSYASAMIYGGAWKDDGPAVLWPFSWPPVIHCKNLPCPNEVYGEPDITPIVVDLNIARNLNLSNWARIVRKHAQPKPWVKGMMGKRINLDSEVIDMPSDKAEIGQLTPVVDGASSETLGRVIDEAICEETQTPSLVLGRPDQQGIPSGIALKLKLWPLINKTETKRTLYGPLIVELLRRLLEAGGWGTDNVVNLKWPEIVPTDPLQEREILEKDQANGWASPQTISQKLGYSYEDEQANIAEHRASQPAPAADGTQPAQPGAQQGAQPQPGQATNQTPPRSQKEIEEAVKGATQSYLQSEAEKIAAHVGA